MARKIKKFKVGIDSETYAISLVDEPAIEEQFVALSKEEEKQQIFLEADTKYMVYGAVLVPDRDIYRNDGEKEFYISFTKESIEKMSQEFMKEYRQNEVTLDHEEAANEVTVVETWLKSDQFKDKSVALGLNEQLPVGTWFVGMKVNNIETWNRIKSGELRGFSVESLISLEEFSKQENNMNIETNDMNFWSKMKEVLSDVFTSTQMGKDPEEELVAETNEQKAETIETEMESEEVVTDVPQPTVETTTVTDEHGTYEVTENGDDIIEIKPVETVEEPKVEEPKDDNKHLEELINSLKEEINALKQMNSGLNDKVKELSKEPSAKPINPQAKPNAGDTYAAWREKMKSYLN